MGKEGIERYTNGPHQKQGEEQVDYCSEQAKYQSNKQPFLDLPSPFSPPCFKN